ncbi:hypothetical protein DM860_018102 [Cuscuta australis]|uniref:Cytokinin riboside 5'-monophosphate phosphoribohydrolase n=1 Tax=Cuscuta australis TaxID=267555 RepID=A0A328EBG8_9ASTE|nr:hypothetical protein DM860_018102 [Cuscuta australis]
MEGTSRTLPYTIRFVGLLGSHSLGRNPKFMATVVDLGRELIRRRISLAYGGGNVGLQGAVASTVFTNGGLVRGFIPGYIATRRVYGPTYGVEHTVSSNYYKYFEMNHAVEAFSVLPGGVDTMEGLDIAVLGLRFEKWEATVGQRCREAYIAVPEVSGNPTLAQQRCLMSNIVVGGLKRQTMFLATQARQRCWLPQHRCWAGLARPMVGLVTPLADVKNTSSPK